MALCAALFVLTFAAACSDDSGDGAPTDVAGEDTAAAEGGAGDDGAGSDATCDYPADGSQPAKQVNPPPGEPTKDGKVPVTITTSAGDIKAVLDAGKTPCTVNSFLSLAQQDYYDDTECHRLGATPGFYMLQCGDPTATGTGGPGYTIPDELSGTETYPAGTLAMANTGFPDSGGGQFFLVYEDTQLNPAYTVFGKMDAASIRLLQGVAAKGTDDSEAPGVGKPNEKVVFEDVK
jgi:peptidyl-prolyl cis-trans isomerase B (cyclophilin B)